MLPRFSLLLPSGFLLHNNLRLRKTAINGSICLFLILGGVFAVYWYIKFRHVLPLRPAHRLENDLDRFAFSRKCWTIFIPESVEHYGEITNFIS